MTEMLVRCAHKEMRDVVSLVPFPKNEHIHPEQQIELLARIMAYQGVRNPITVSTRSGFIVSGHGRLLAAKLNGWKKFPVDLQDFEDEAQEAAARVADNAIQELAELDRGMVDALTLTMPEGFDLELLGIPGLELAEVSFGEPAKEPEPEKFVPNIIAIPEIIHGDCLEELKKLAADSVDALVTDPPYGIRFMGKAWDAPDIEDTAKATPHVHHSVSIDGSQRRARLKPAEAAGTYDNSPEAMQKFQEWSRAWAIEVYRVLKPGGHLLSFASPRTYHRMATGIEEAGFEVRDQLQWIFSTGFPKSLSIEKAFEKNGNSEAAQKYVGFGSGLKPANEPILLARKKLSEPTLIANVLKWGTGAINVDASRIRAGNQIDSDGKRPYICEACAKKQDGSFVSFAAKRTGHGEAGISTSFVDTSVEACQGEGESTTHSDGSIRPGTSDLNSGTMESESIATSSSTDSFGENQSQRGTSSIISTKTSKTIGLKTCSSCGAPITFECMPENQRFTRTEAPQGNTQGDGKSATPSTGRRQPPTREKGAPLGRFPSNLLLSHSPGCVEVGTKEVKGTGATRNADFKATRKDTAGFGYYGESTKGESVHGGFANNDGTETIPSWECEESCAVRLLDVRLLDLQSGQSRSDSPNRNQKTGGHQNSYVGGKLEAPIPTAMYTDSGGASRFFKTFEATRFAYVPKSSRRERNAGMEGMEPRRSPSSMVRCNGQGDTRLDGKPMAMNQNHHPTVKPLALMRYLINLICPPGGLVVDPFLGSGTTGVAAAQCGMRFLGIEKEAEYVAIATHRFTHELNETDEDYEDEDTEIEPDSEGELTDEKDPPHA